MANSLLEITFIWVTPSPELYFFFEESIWFVFKVVGICGSNFIFWIVCFRN